MNETNRDEEQMLLSEEQEMPATDLTAEAAQEQEASAGAVSATEATGEAPTSASSSVDAREAERLCAHPMFARFACGRSEDFNGILSAFRDMLSAGGTQETAKEIAVRMTPTATMAAQDVPLTERQRAICRAAGMTYREYHSLMEEK